MTIAYGAAAGTCRIVTVTSTAALIGQSERSACGISKAALARMTRMLAVEMG